MTIRSTLRVSVVFTISGRASPTFSSGVRGPQSGKYEKYDVLTAAERFKSMGVSRAIGLAAYRPIAQPFRPKCPWLLAPERR
jgi:hypothetical protein